MGGNCPCGPLDVWCLNHLPLPPSLDLRANAFLCLALRTLSFNHLVNVGLMTPEWPVVLMLGNACTFGPEIIFQPPLYGKNRLSMNLSISPLTGHVPKAQREQRTSFRALCASLCSIIYSTNLFSTWEPHWKQRDTTAGFESLFL